MGQQSSKSNHSKKVEIFDTETLIEEDDVDVENPFQDILNYEEAFKKIEKTHRKQKQEQEIKRRQQLEILENKIVTEIQKITSDEIGNLNSYFFFRKKIELKIDYDYNCNHESKGIDILIGKLNIHLVKKGWKIDKWDIHHPSCYSTDRQSQIYIELIKNK